MHKILVDCTNIWVGDVLVFSITCAKRNTTGVTNRAGTVQCFVDCCLSFCPSLFGNCVVCPLIYVLWISLWYLQIFG